MIDMPAAARASQPSRYRPTKLLQLFVGLFLFAAGTAAIIRSELGLGPWDAFHVGLSLLTPLSVGAAIVAVGLAIVAATWACGVRPGFATLANMLLVGTFVDLLLPILPPPSSTATSVAYLALGIGLTGFSTGMYIGAGLGSGPRDSLMVLLTKRTGWPVRRVRTMIEATVLALGWVMGGQIWIGTVVYALTIGPATQWGLSLFGVSVRKSET